MQSTDESIILKNRTIFLLNHKDTIDFNKGLERIEITIENTIDTNEIQTPQKEMEEFNKESLLNPNRIKSNTDLNSVNFIFDETKRRWVRHIDR